MRVNPLKNLAIARAPVINRVAKHVAGVVTAAQPMVSENPRAAYDALMQASQELNMKYSVLAGATTAAGTLAIFSQIFPSITDSIAVAAPVFVNVGAFALIVGMKVSQFTEPYIGGYALATKQLFLDFLSASLTDKITPYNALHQLMSRTGDAPQIAEKLNEIINTSKDPQQRQQATECLEAITPKKKQPVSLQLVSPITATEPKTPKHLALGRPAHSSATYFASQARADTLYESLQPGQAKILAGPPRSGKSSIGKRVLEIARNEGSFGLEASYTMLAQMDLVTHENLSDRIVSTFAESIEENIDYSIGDPIKQAAFLEKIKEFESNTNPLPALDEWLGEQNQKVYIHFDELVKLVTETEDDSLLINFINQFKGLENIYPLIDWVDVNLGREALAKAQFDAPVQYLSTLDQEETSQYIREVLDGTPITDEALNEFYDLSGGHLFVLNHLLREFTHGSFREITVSEIRTQLRIEGINGEILGGFFEIDGNEEMLSSIYNAWYRVGLNEEEKFTLRKIACFDPPINLDSIEENLIKRPLQAGWVEVRNGQYRIKGRILRAWLNNQRD
jgi:hypothetical protein